MTGGGLALGNQQSDVTRELNKARMYQKQKEIVAGRGDFQKTMYMKLKRLIHGKLDLSGKKGIKKSWHSWISPENKQDKSLIFVKFPARPECLS